MTTTTVRETRAARLRREEAEYATRLAEQQLASQKYERARARYFREITKLFGQLQELGQSMPGLPEHIFSRVIPADRILWTKPVPAVLLFRVVGHNAERHANWDAEAPDGFLGEVYYLTSEGEVYYRCEDTRPLHTSRSNWVHH